MINGERYRTDKQDYLTEVAERAIAWTLHEPLDVDYDEVGLVVPGILAARRLYNPYAHASAERGVPMVTMAHPGASAFCSDEVVAIGQTVAEKLQKPVRLHGHSLGGIHATQAALKAPDIFSGLLLMQPAGYKGVYPLHFVRSLLERNNDYLIDELVAIVEGVQYVAATSPKDMAKTIIMASRHKIIQDAQGLDPRLDRDALLFPDDVLIRVAKLSHGLTQAGFTLHDMDPDGHLGHDAIMYQSQAVAHRAVEITQARSYQARDRDARAS